MTLRVWALIVLVTSIAISGYYRARARKLSGTIERRREGGLALAARAAGGLGAFGPFSRMRWLRTSWAGRRSRRPEWVAWTGA